MLKLVMADGEPPAVDRKVNAWLDDYGRVFACAFSSERLKMIDWLGVGTYVFSFGSHEVRVWAEPEIPIRAVLDVFSRIQPIILQALGWQTLHAGATIGPYGVLAFCGRSGSGKSTLAFAMQQVGWQQFADDAVVLRVEQDRVMTCRLPFKPQLRTASRAHFASVPCPPPSVSAQPSAKGALSAVFLLQRDIHLIRPLVSLVPPAQAFSEMLAHAHCFDINDPMHTRQMIEAYLEMIERVPVYAVQYTPNFHKLSELTEAVLSAVSRDRVQIA